MHFSLSRSNVCPPHNVVSVFPLDLADCFYVWQLLYGQRETQLSVLFIYRMGLFFLALVSSSGNETLARNTLSYSAYLQYAAHLAEVEEAVVFEWIRLKRFCLCNNNIRWGIYSMHCFFLYSRYFASQIFSPPRAMPKALFNPVNLALVAKRLKLFRLVRLVTKLLSCVSFWGKYKTFGDFSKLILNTKKFTVFLINPSSRMNQQYCH